MKTGALLCGLVLTALAQQQPAFEAATIKVDSSGEPENGDYEHGRLLIRNAQYAKDPRPIDEACRCAVCQRYSRAYLRHLYSTGEFLSVILNTHHNLYFYLDIMRKIREAIRFGKLGRFRSDLQARLT